MSSNSIAELDRVQFEPSRPPRKEEEEEDEEVEDSGDEPESDVTAEPPDAENEYYVDVIKQATYRDSKRTRKEDGFVGWHYQVMWNGYLKSQSDSEEPISSFGAEPDGTIPVVDEFWQSVNRKPWARSHEPRGRMNETVEVPEARMTQWLKEVKPRRYYSLYVKRKRWQADNPNEPIPRRFSDYYRRKKNLEEKARLRTEMKEEKPKTEDATVLAASGPSRIAPASSRQIRHATPPKGRSVSLSPLDSIFNSDNEVDAALPSQPRGSESDLSPLIVVAGTKRKKRMISSSPAPQSQAESSRQGAQAAIATAGVPKKVKRSPVKAAVPLPPPAYLSNNTSARLDNFGKIAKRGPEPVGQPTFGEPEPGIFDPPPSALPTPPMSVPAVAATAPSGLFLRTHSPSPPPTAEPVSGPSDVIPASLPAPLAHTPMTLPTGPMANTVPRPEQTTPPIVSTTHAVHTLPAVPVNQPPPAPRSSPPPPPGASPPPPPPSMTTHAPLHEKQISPNIHTNPATSKDPRRQNVPVVTGSTPAVVSNPVSTEAAKTPASAQPSSLSGQEFRLPFSERGKYVQPKKIQVLDGFGDPEVRRPHPKSAQPAPRSDLDGSTPIRPPPITNLARPIPTGPASASSINRPHAFVPRSAGPPSMRLPPKQPHGQPESTYGGRQPGPLQPNPYQSERVALNIPPRPTYGNLSPDLSDGKSPPWQANTSPYVPPTPVSGALTAPQYDKAKDPRLAGRPLPTGPASTTPIGAGLTGGRSPLYPSPGSDLSRFPHDPRLKRIESEFLADIALSFISDTEVLSRLEVDVRLLRGSQISPAGKSLLQTTLGTSARTRSTCALNMEEVEVNDVQAHLRGGSKFVEWSAVRPVTQPAPSAWDTLASRAGRAAKAFVSYTELELDGSVSCHYAVLLASPQHFDHGELSPPARDVGLAVYLIALPIAASSLLVDLPNPVKPDGSIKGEDMKPILHSKSTGAEQVELLASLGMSESFMDGLRHRSGLIYPGQEGSADIMHVAIKQAFRGLQVVPPEQDKPPDVVIVSNAKLLRTLRSSTIRHVLPRRTQLYAWQLRPVWATGVLVTFSPTFILLNPQKFLEIMQTIRTSGNWAAYVIPSVIEWASLSWTEPRRCRDPTKAYDALSRSLFLDHQLLQISGSAASSGGGLAVSCAPPSYHNIDACMDWTAWLRKVCEAPDFQSLVELSLGVRSDTFVTTSAPDRPPSSMLDQIDIETAQIKDLTAMRMRPHLLPYRRYMYIGEISLERGSRDKIGGAVEFVAAEDFPAIFSGAI